MPDNQSPSPFQRRYPPEMRERAVRLVAETIAEAGGERHGAVTRVGRRLGIGTESLRTRLRQAEIEAGQQRRSPAFWARSQRPSMPCIRTSP